MTNRTDPMTLLTELRPTSLDEEWDRAARDRMLARLLDDEPATTPALRWRPRRRWVVAAAVAAAGAAAAVVAAVLAPAGSPGGPDPAAAAAVQRLAVVAGTHGRAVGPGQYAYVSVSEEQTTQPGIPVIPGTERVDGVDRDHYEQWTAPDGSLWIRHTVDGTGGCLEADAPIDANPADGDYADVSSSALAALPTDPDALASYFDAHPTGDNRGSGNRFMIASDLVASGLASPQLRAAALRVLAQTPGIEVVTAARDSQNRPAIRVSHGESHGFTDIVYFDPQTSYVLERSSVQDGSTWHYTGAVLVSSVVDQLPDAPACPPGGSGG